MLGRVREDTSWRSYIMTIGMNIASKEWRKKSRTETTDIDGDPDDETKSTTARKVAALLRSQTGDEGETPLYKSLEAQSLLGNELLHTPEPCGLIIRLFYYEGLSMEQIAEMLGYKNAATVKAKKCQCMAELVKHVTVALNRAGYDVKPRKRGSKS